MLEPEIERLERLVRAVLGELGFRWQHEKPALELTRRARIFKLQAEALVLREQSRAGEAFVLEARARELEALLSLGEATFSKASLEGRVIAALARDVQHADVPEVDDGDVDAEGGAQDDDASASDADDDAPSVAVSDCGSEAAPDERRERLLERQACRDVVPERLMARLALEDDPAAEAGGTQAGVHGDGAGAATPSRAAASSVLPLADAPSAPELSAAAEAAPRSGAALTPRLCMVEAGQDVAAMEAWLADRTMVRARPTDRPASLQSYPDDAYVVRVRRCTGSVAELTAQTWRVMLSTSFDPREAWVPCKLLDFHNILLQVRLPRVPGCWCCGAACSKCPRI